MDNLDDGGGSGGGVDVAPFASYPTSLPINPTMSTFLNGSFAKYDADATTVLTNESSSFLNVCLAISMIQKSYKRSESDTKLNSTSSSWNSITTENVIHVSSLPEKLAKDIKRLTTCITEHSDIRVVTLAITTLVNIVISNYYNTKDFSDPTITPIVTTDVPNLLLSVLLSNSSSIVNTKVHSDSICDSAVSGLHKILVCNPRVFEVLIINKLPLVNRRLQF